MYPMNAMAAVSADAGGLAMAAQMSAPVWDDGYCALWLDNLDAKAKTKLDYGKNIKRFALYLTATGTAYPTQRTVVEFRDSLSAAGRKATTVNAYLITAKQMFKWLARVGKYPDVAAGVKTLRVSREAFKRDNLTKVQAEALLAEAKGATDLRGLRDKALIALAMTAGLRTVELARADIGDLRTVGGQRYLQVQGKGHDDKDRVVKVDPNAEAAIGRYLSGRGDAAADAPLFCSHSRKNSGARMRTESVSRIVKGHLRRAGMDTPRLTAHSLRHTAATFAILNGAPTEQVQQMLGHTSINTTMIYNHAIDRERNNAELLAGRYINWGDFAA